MKTSLGPYLKAIVAGVLAGLSQLYIALADNNITAQEWTTVAIWAITAAAAIYGVPNTPTTIQGFATYDPAGFYTPPPVSPPQQFPAEAVNAAQQNTAPTTNLAPGA